MNRSILFISALFCSTAAYAQDHAQPTQSTGRADTIETSEGKMHIGKESTDLRKKIDDRNSGYYGTTHVGFQFTTISGEEINKSTSQDKVSLFAFWDPSTNYDLKNLNELNTRQKDNPNFQLVVLTFDTTGLARMIADEKLELKFAKVRDMNELQRINYGNGTPKYMIMARGNVIRGIGHLKYWEECMAALKKVL